MSYMGLVLIGYGVRTFFEHMNNGRNTFLESPVFIKPITTKTTTNFESKQSLKDGCSTLELLCFCVVVVAFDV